MDTCSLIWVITNKYCSNCGNPISAGSKFCNSCGRSVSGVAPIAQPITQTATRRVDADEVLLTQI
ncbi:MAG: zinc-ribbon domain-containing protein [Prevotellaceae bacterium]|nr:zinc-ribbon domain-containing protein [Prevotellaceae bacterium]